MTTNQKMKSRVKLLALSDNSFDVDIAYLLIDMKNKNKKWERILLPSKMVLKLSDLRSFLIDQGHPLEFDDKYWKDIQRILSSATDGRVNIVSSPGWVGNNYLGGDGKTIGLNEKGYKPILSSNTQLQAFQIIKKGTLLDWKKHVASFGLYSSRLMLALCSGLSGYIVRFSDVENGGFHFYGSSSIGKSSGLKLAASICSNSSFVGNWDQTEKGFEESTIAHNDSMMIKDEIMSLHSDPIKATRIAKKLTHKLIDGRPMIRAKGYQPQYTSSPWQVVLLSAGELSLNEQAHGAGVSRMGGEQVRIIDIPADVGCGKGVFEYLPKNVKSSAEFSDGLQRNCNLYFGSARNPFLRRVSRILRKDGEEKLRQMIQGNIDNFMNSVDINLYTDIEEGQKVRIAKRFALAYAAGVLAMKLGILPFTNEQVMDGVSKCLKAAMQPVANKIETMQSDFLKMMKEIKPKDIIETQKTLYAKDIEDDNYVRASIGNKIVIAVKKTVLDNQINNEADRRLLLKSLVADGFLYADEAGKSTRQLTLKGKEKKVRRYCFLEEKLLAL